MRIRYIGSFPPPYGGVTIKNKLIADCLSKYFSISYPPRQSWIPSGVRQLLSIAQAMIPFQTLILGISSRGGKSWLITKLLFCFNRRTMNRSLYFMMGGQECYRIAASEEELKCYSNYKQIYVETDSMADALKRSGLTNVSIFPNCRQRPKIDYSNRVVKGQEKLRCVFFSQIQPQKGVGLILEAARSSPDIEFSFYGSIDPGFIEEFQEKVELYPNCRYMGVFKGSNEEVYRELSGYDVLLFPTQWDTEGVPGILVEAKIAGLPCIVSNMSYNSELVQDNEEGIVLSENDAESLVQAISRLDQDRELLQKLSDGSYHSAERFYIENFIEEIAKQV